MYDYNSHKYIYIFMYMYIYINSANTYIQNILYISIHAVHTSKSKLCFNRTRNIRASFHMNFVQECKPIRTVYWKGCKARIMKQDKHFISLYSSPQGCKCDHQDNMGFFLLGEEGRMPNLQFTVHYCMLTPPELNREFTPNKLQVPYPWKGKDCLPTIRVFFKAYV